MASFMAGLAVAISCSPFDCANAERNQTEAKSFPKSRHHELMSFGPHGQHGTTSGAHDALGNAAHKHMSKTRSSVRGEYDQVDIMLAGVGDDLGFWRSLNYCHDDSSTCRPFRIENAGQGLIRRRLGLADVFWQVEAQTKVGRRSEMGFQRVQ